MGPDRHGGEPPGKGVGRVITFLLMLIAAVLGLIYLKDKPGWMVGLLRSVVVICAVIIVLRIINGAA